MDVTTGIDGGKARIALAGKMTVQTSPELDAAVCGLPQEVFDVDIDLAAVDYVSSAGLRALVAAGAMATRRGGRLRLLRPQRNVCEMFDLTGLSSVLAIER